MQSLNSINRPYTITTEDLNLITRVCGFYDLFIGWSEATNRWEVNGTHPLTYMHWDSEMGVDAFFEKLETYFRDIGKSLSKTH